MRGISFLSFREWIFCAVRIAISNTWCRLARGKLFIVTLYFTHKLKLRTHFDELHYHNLTNWDQDWKLKLTKDTFNTIHNNSNIEHFYTQPRTFMIHFMIIVMMTSYHYHFSDSLGKNNNRDSICSINNVAPTLAYQQGFRNGQENLNN